MDFKKKYLKYKSKYLRLKQFGGENECKIGKSDDVRCPAREFNCYDNDNEVCLNKNGENLLNYLKNRELGDLFEPLDDIRNDENLPEAILSKINSFNDCDDIINYLSLNKDNINSITQDVWEELIKNKMKGILYLELSEFVKAKMCELIDDDVKKTKCNQFYTKCQFKYLNDKYDMWNPKKAWYESIRQGNINDYKLFNNFTDTTTIGNGAFYNNELTSVNIPNSVTTLGKHAFSRNRLTSVVIPNSVKTIGDGAFFNNKLKSIVIPKSVETIDKLAFAGNKLTSVVIPNSVTTIGNSAFSYNKLKSVEIPNSVTTIGNNAFSSNKLTSVIIPNSVTTIGDEAFDENVQIIRI